MAKIAVMGYGTIGSGVVEAFSMNQKSIQKKAGEEITVKYILDIRDFPGSPIESLIVHDYQVIAQDSEISVVVETMGGVEPANTFVMAMLEAGKSVVTSNKALVAEYGVELMETAAAHHCQFLFGASVGGGIPIIRPLTACLTPDVVTEITGILNGTTNYILTEMSQKGVSFEEALKEAQALGYAEKDPTADVSGGDTCRKIAILSSVAMGRKVVFTDIHMEGITGVSTEDFQYASAMDMSIKLLASSKMSEDHSSMKTMVAPFLIHRNHPLYSVQDVFNAVMVTGNIVDTLMFYGRGAGKLPTAAAVAADVIEIVKGTCATIPWEKNVLVPDDYKQYQNRFLVRLPEDTDSALYQKIFQPEQILTGIVPNEIGLITAPMTEACYLEAEKEIGKVISRTRLYA